MVNEVILVKIGGGLIAPKEWPEETVDQDLVKRLINEIIDSGKKVVVAVGSGNFAHNAVKKYGIADEDGVRKVRLSAIKPGKIVCDEFKNQGLEAVLVEPNKIYITNDEVLEKDGSDEIIKILEKNKIPVVYGDVIDDKKKGWIIFSGEKNLEIILGRLQKSDFKVKKVIQVSRELGVLDNNGKVVPEINKNNWDEIKKDVTGAVGVDVTGGMLHKVEESMEMFRNYGVESWIISGKVEGRLKSILNGTKVVGTKIC
jgi:isopentenyl phosphate kinase